MSEIINRSMAKTMVGKILHVDGDTHLSNQKNVAISILPSR